MKEKLSVIVPVYNKEGYLERSLTTLRNQTYQDIEVIIVDDGSTDRSKKVCMKFCAEDNRFKYYYKNNGGVASARNFGLDKASGGYIGFVDPDDYIEIDMYEKMLNTAIERNADIVGCGIRMLLSNEIKKITESRDYELTSKNAAIHLLKWDNMVTPYLWNKIFRKSILKEIRFNEKLKVGEDFPFVFECILHASGYIHICNFLYTYVRNADSLVGIKYKCESSKNSIYSSIYVCELSNIKYHEFTDICKYSLLLNCYFQMSMILHEKVCNDMLWKDLIFFQKFSLKIDKRIIKNYGGVVLYLKAVLCFKYPQLYRKILQIRSKRTIR